MGLDPQTCGSRWKKLRKFAEVALCQEFMDVGLGSRVSSWKFRFPQFWRARVMASFGQVNFAGTVPGGVGFVGAAVGRSGASRKGVPKRELGNEERRNEKRMREESRVNGGRRTLTTLDFLLLYSLARPCLARG